MRFIGKSLKKDKAKWVYLWVRKYCRDNKIVYTKEQHETILKQEKATIDKEWKQYKK